MKKERKREKNLGKKESFSVFVVLGRKNRNKILLKIEKILDMTHNIDLDMNIKKKDSF